MTTTGQLSLHKETPIDIGPGGSIQLMLEGGATIQMGRREFLALAHVGVEFMLSTTSIDTELTNADVRRLIRVADELVNISDAPR